MSPSFQLVAVSVTCCDVVPFETNAWICGIPAPSAPFPFIIGAANGGDRVGFALTRQATSHRDRALAEVGLVEPDVDEHRLAGAAIAPRRSSAAGTSASLRDQNARRAEALRDLVVVGAREHGADVVLSIFTCSRAICVQPRRCRPPRSPGCRGARRCRTRRARSRTRRRRR